MQSLQRKIRTENYVKQFLILRQEIKVISGTPTAQLTALPKLQCTTIQSREKFNSHVHTKIHVCIHTHIEDTQRHRYIGILDTSIIGWIIINIIVIVLTSELFKCHSMEMNKSKKQHLSSLEGQPPQAQNGLSEFTQCIS